MTMWKLKNCPRCQGDLFMDKNLDGWYQRCLQCGYQREMKPIAEVKRDQPAVPVVERLPTSGVETPSKRRPARSMTTERERKDG